MIEDYIVLAIILFFSSFLVTFAFSVIASVLFED